MPGVADIALIIFKYQLVVVQLQVVFGCETVCIFAAPANPHAGHRIGIDPINRVFMLYMFYDIPIATIKL